MCWHRWNKWEKIQVKMYHTKYKVHYLVTYQRRVCIKCGKEQREELDG
jgi:hypothetical protein